MSALTLEDRTELGRMVVNLLDDWGIGAAHQISMLGSAGRYTNQNAAPLPGGHAVTG